MITLFRCWLIQPADRPTYLPARKRTLRSISLNFGQIKIGIRVKENRKFRDKLFFFPPLLLPPDAPFVGKPIKQEDERGLKYFQNLYDPKGNNHTVVTEKILPLFNNYNLNRDTFSVKKYLRCATMY